MANKVVKGKEVIRTPWFVRLAIYVVIAVVGLVLTVMGFTNPEMVDAWLGQTGSIAALVGGLLAAVNTNRGSDEVAVEIEDKPVTIVSDAGSYPVSEVETVKEEGTNFSVFYDK